MKITILIPCHNEQSGLPATISSCLDQSRQADEIVIVDDGSTDNTRKIILEAAKKHEKIKPVLLDENTGIKSMAQEHGLRHVTGDVFITLDADTEVSYRFVRHVEMAFEDENVVAFSGYVQSNKRNLLTACREIEYTLLQNIFKYAQSLVGFVYIIPGCAGAFRTDFFKREMLFEHDTLAEDLDISYQVNASTSRIIFDTKAVVRTNDPDSLRSYIGQVRRWYGGTWQCLLKHISQVLNNPLQTLFLSMMFLEGLVGLVGIIYILFMDVQYFVLAISYYIALAFAIGLVVAITRKRLDLMLAAPFYPLLHLLNLTLFLEQFIKTVIFRTKNLTWYKPARY